MEHTDELVLDKDYVIYKEGTDAFNGHVTIYEDITLFDEVEVKPAVEAVPATETTPAIEAIPAVTEQVPVAERFWVEAHRTDVITDFLTLEAAEAEYNKHINDTQFYN